MAAGLGHGCMHGMGHGWMEVAGLDAYRYIHMLWSSRMCLPKPLPSDELISNLYLKPQAHFTCAHGSLGEQRRGLACVIHAGTSSHARTLQQHTSGCGEEARTVGGRK